MTDAEIMKKCLGIVHQLDDIIWWTKTIDNPIYDVDEKGKRHSRDLYEIKRGFAKKYNELYDRGVRIEDATE
jgi:hypothetical protein